MNLRQYLGNAFPAASGAWIWISIALAAAGCLVLFFVLQTLPGRARKLIIAAVTFLAGLFYAAEFFLPVNPETEENILTFAVPTVGNVTNVLAAFTLGLGVFSLVRIHGGKVAKLREGWENSVVLLLGIVVMAVAGLRYEESRFYRSLFRDVLNSFDAAMFATLAFFIISAAYRAFRVKSAEATLLMFAALVVMLGQIPIGQYLTHWIPEKGTFASLFRLDNISNWLLITVNAPATRAIGFGLGIGALAIAMRLWLSLERGAFFEAKAE
ncbi:MAG: hypothetical protein FJX72_14635 [Armatimonadetes bacterium]|nr:hypothetical protein [Armatimonadota bacterium]